MKPPEDETEVGPCRLCGHDQTSLRWSLKGYRIGQCPSCSVFFVANVPEPTKLDSLVQTPFSAKSPALAIAPGPFFEAILAFYERIKLALLYGELFQSRGGKYDHADGLTAMQANTRRRLRRIRAVVPGGRLLDVGCSTGQFLLAARRLFEVEGVEVSEEAAATARSRGLAVRVVPMLSQLIDQVEPFDIITLWDVIEHLPDPLGTIAAIQALLKPNGFLVMSTGNAASVVARLSGRYWHLLTPPFHLFFFTPRSIRWLLGEVGFSMVRLEHPGKHVSLGFAAFKLAERVPSPCTRIVDGLVQRLPLRRWALPVNLCDIMTVWAIKPSAIRMRELSHFE